AVAGCFAAVCALAAAAVATATASARTIFFTEPSLRSDRQLLMEVRCAMALPSAICASSTNLLVIQWFPSCTGPECGLPKPHNRHTESERQLPGMSRVEVTEGARSSR